MMSNSYTKLISGGIYLDVLTANAASSTDWKRQSVGMDPGSSEASWLAC